MKDKITVAIVCTFFIGMYWISRSSSVVSSNESFISEKTISTSYEDTIIDFIDYETPEMILFDEAELQIEISTINTCTLKSSDTDALAFGEAFGYYRKCLGSDNSFQWKGTEYTTLILQEVIIHVVDSVKINDSLEEAEFSQIH